MRGIGVSYQIGPVGIILLAVYYLFVGTFCLLVIICIGLLRLGKGIFHFIQDIRNPPQQPLGRHAPARFQ